MSDILHRIPIDARPEKVLPIVSTTAGLKSWWTDDCEAEPRVGFVDVFRFDGGAVEFHFRVDEIGPGHVAWTCVDAPKVPPEWVGTRITFDWSSGKTGGSVLRFGHGNWRSVDGEFPACNTVWGELMHRLKESAEGRPRGPYFTSAASRSRY